RKEAADRRAQLKPLQSALVKLEKKIESLQVELTQIQELLADPSLYDEARKSELADLVKREGALKSEIESLEERWLGQQEAIEALQAP
ncbi:MAG: hypothetical protein RLZZ602_2175, partial [Pseudomonadota bacterium]